jgi:hypothetical protein
VPETSESVAPYKFEIKDAPNAQATPVGESREGVKDAAGNPPLQAYRFKLRTKDGMKVPAAIAVAQAGLEVSDLHWETQEFEHGEETVMHARIANYDGKPIKFVVEHDHGGKWKPFAEVPGVVKDGEATGTLLVHHPVLPPTGSLPSSSKLKSAQPAQLRFYVERGEAKQQERAESKPPKATSQPPEPKPTPRAQTGSLQIKGAFAGEGFFIVNAKTNKPVRVGEGHEVKTKLTAVKGVYFILPRDRTAKFDRLPAGPYKVIFPPDQVEGEKPKQPVVKANEHGAHVVDIKDFVHQGAVCEIEVAAGASPTLELTLSADGTARVCC